MRAMNNSFFSCEPNCPKRKPGCQDSCKRHQEQRARYDARKKEYYGDSGLRQYFAERREKAKDIYVKQKKNSKSYKRTMD